MGYGFEIDSINLESDNYGYTDEYLLSIIDGDIIIEKMKHENGYYEAYGDVVYVLDNCSSKVLESIDKENAYEVRIATHEDEEKDKICTCGKCTYKKKDEESTLKVTVNGKEITDEKEKEKYASKIIFAFNDRLDDFFFW